MIQSYENWNQKKRWQNKEYTYPNCGNKMKNNNIIIRHTDDFLVLSDQNFIQNNQHHQFGLEMKTALYHTIFYQ